MKNIKHVKANETDINANKIVIAIYTPIYFFATKFAKINITAYTFPIQLDKIFRKKKN